MDLCVIRNLFRLSSILAALRKLQNWSFLNKICTNCKNYTKLFVLIIAFGDLSFGNMHPAKYSSEYLVAVIVSVIVLNISVQNVEAELTPPYFNLAEGRQISATATCGVGTDGPELYCKLVGANTEHDNYQHKYELIQGQVSTDLTKYTSFSIKCKRFSIKTNQDKTFSLKY